MNSAHTTPEGTEMFLHVLSLAEKGLPSSQVVKLALEHVSRGIGGAVLKPSGTFHKGTYYWHTTQHSTSYWRWRKSSPRALHPIVS
jgi:hypothetical protein